jgi:hypothetical protein
MERTCAWTLLLAVLTCGASCRAKEKEFYDRVFACEPSQPPDSCGTTREGRAMACYSAKQLGGQAFCAETCDPETTPPVHEGVACLAAGVRVRTCRPTAERDDPVHGCPSGLNCYRTDLLADDGLCLAAPVCTTDNDCKADPFHPRCAAPLIGDFLPGFPLAVSNLHCVAPSCKGPMSTCPTGEHCLPSVIGPSASVPDICVPVCIGGWNCPPNFVCMRKVYGPQAPEVCVPGVPGARCTSDHDCLVGTCTDTGAGFSVCSFPCRGYDDCAVLNSATEVFLCVPDVAGLGNHCVNTARFSGTVCDPTRSDQCGAGEECFKYNPYGERPLGECRVPCPVEGGCPMRGGVPHVCLEGGRGGCYPGRFGLPCADTRECGADFQCVDVSADGGGALGDKICTIPCISTADCDAHSWTTRDGYCRDGYCLLGGGDGAACEQNEQCRTDTCETPAGALTGACLQR